VIYVILQIWTVGLHRSEQHVDLRPDPAIGQRLCAFGSGHYLMHVVFRYFKDFVNELKAEMQNVPQNV